MKVTKINPYAFYKYNKVISFTTKASKMRTIELPNTIQTIGRYAFYQCGKLESINIPQSVATIESYAFSSCVNMTDLKINIDDSLLYQGLQPVASTTDSNVETDKDIIITGGRELNSGDILTLSAKSRDGVSISQDKIVWSADSDTVTISTDAANNAIMIAKKTGAVKITATYKDDPSIKATLSLNVKKVNVSKTIDCTAFDRCSDLESVIITAINPNSISIIGDNIYFALNNKCTIYVPKGSVDMYKNHDSWSRFASQIKEIQ